jgi:cytochrome c oxidase subunit 2
MAAGLAALLVGCAGAPAVTDPAGPRAARIAELWWLMLALAAVVVAVVFAALLVALLRPRRREASARPGAAEGAVGEAGETMVVVIAGAALPALILAGLTVFTVRVLAAAAPPAPPALSVEVTGHLYWWEVAYPAAGFVTANEVRVPVGQPVELRLRSADVIHSFWVPRLLGKLDLVPGRVNTTWLQAAEAGTYRGLCAEYCGVQHARMGFLVVAEPPEEFATWLAAQQQPAAAPSEPLALAGARAFAREGCINCHVIRYGAGPAGVPVGPDLTHVGSRLTLGAATLPNTRGHLGGWIGNPQALKPGNLMPTVPLDGESLLALTAYLESLR